MNLAMLGMWHTHADGIVRQVAEHPDEFSLVGFYDPDPAVVAERSRQWGPKIPGFRVFEKPEQLLGIEKLDGVVVEGRVYENLALARLALESGRPVMLEKPAGTRLDEYRELVDLAQRKHLHVQMIYLFRYMSAVQELLKRVRAGDLGRIYDVPRPPAQGPAVVPAVRQRAGALQGGHLLRDGRARNRHDGGDLGRPQKRRAVPRPPSRRRAEELHRQRPGRVRLRPRLGNHRGAGTGSRAALAAASKSTARKGACVIPHLGSGHLANKNIQPIETFKAGDRDWQTHELPAATLQIADLRQFAAVVLKRAQPDFTLAHDLIVQEALLKSSGMV